MSPDPGRLTPRGYVDGVLYCYGGCGRRYQDFGLDVIVSTPIWNQIAVGAPFDDTQTDIDREGRGGVLCAQCTVERLRSIVKATVAFVTTDGTAQAEGDERVRQMLTTSAHLAIARAEQAEAERDRLQQLWMEVGQYIDAAHIGYNQPQILAVFTDNQSLRSELAALRQDRDTLRAALRKHAIQDAVAFHDFKGMCFECDSEWNGLKDEAEHHAHDCLAAPPREE